MPQRWDLSIDSFELETCLISLCLLREFLNLTRNADEGLKFSTQETALSELRELRQLREENGKLKRLVADLSLDRHILQEIVQKKL